MAISVKNPSDRNNLRINEETSSISQENIVSRSEKDGFYSSCGQAFIRIS